MYRELNEIMDLDGSSVIDGRRLVVSHDRNADSGFVIHCVLASYLRRGYSVVFVTVAQTFGHYNRAAFKSGLNLRLARDQGQLLCVDFLGVATRMERPDLRDLYFQIKKLAMEMGKPFLLIVDDVSTFVGLGSTPAEVAAFAHYCWKVDGSAGCLFGMYEPQSDDQECRQLVGFLRHRADLDIQVCGLQTGFSRDVHGQIRFVDEKGERLFQFKLEEKRVRIFPVGTSAAVL